MSRIGEVGVVHGPDIPNGFVPHLFGVVSGLLGLTLSSLTLSEAGIAIFLLQKSLVIIWLFLMAYYFYNFTWYSKDLAVSAATWASVLAGCASILTLSAYFISFGELEIFLFMWTIEDTIIGIFFLLAGILFFKAGAWDESDTVTILAGIAYLLIGAFALVVTLDIFFYLIPFFTNMDVLSLSLLFTVPSILGLGIRGSSSRSLREQLSDWLNHP